MLSTNNLHKSGCIGLPKCFRVEKEIRTLKEFEQQQVHMSATRLKYIGTNTIHCGGLFFVHGIQIELICGLLILSFIPTVEPHSIAGMKLSVNQIYNTLRKAETYQE